MAGDAGWAVLASAALAGAGAWAAVPGRSSARLAAVSGTRSPTPIMGRAAALLRRMVGGLALGPHARRRRAIERQRVIQCLSALAAELAAGHPPAGALVRCAGDPSVWPSAAAAASVGADIPSALLIDAEGAPVLRHLAACWSVSGETGAGLRSAVTMLADSSRAAEDVRADLEAQLAGPRASARMMAALPLVGLLFGVMLGADPLRWLVGCLPGVICLLGGATLIAVGMWWTGRIAAAVERRL